MGRSIFNVILGGIALYFFPLLSFGLAAPKQVSFALEPGSVNYRYNYVWRNSEGQEIPTRFGLHVNDVGRGSSEFEDVVKADESEVARKLQDRANKIGKKLNVDVIVEQSQGDYSFRVEGYGLTQAILDKIFGELRYEQEKLKKDYLKSKFYVGERSGDVLELRPDYKTLVKRYQPVSTIVAKALDMTSPKDLRGRAEHALEFIQSIPYSQQTTNGTDFQTPIGMYTENMGDCDTKSVALACILSHLGIRSVLALIPEHMFIGIEVVPQAGDQTFKHQGRTYVVAEPSGIGYPLGKADEGSMEGLFGGKGQVITY